MSSMDEGHIESDGDNFSLIGINYGSCPPLIRSTIFGGETDLRIILTSLNSEKNKSVYGVLTCDRLEIYFCKSIFSRVQLDFFNLLAARTYLDPRDLERVAYKLSGKVALKHFFKVVSAMESQVIGEPQILGQVRTCEQISRSIAPASIFLNHIFKYAFSVAKRVKNETKISEGPTSLAAAAIRVARNINGELTSCNGLIFGLDETAIFLAEQFEQAGVKKFITAASAEFYSKNPNVLKADLQLEARSQLIANSDVALICNNDTNYTITKKMVSSALRLRKYKPLFIIDLGVPGAVEPSVESLDAAFVYNLENLEQLAVEGIEKRVVEKQKAEGIILEELETFYLRPPNRDIGVLAREIREALENELQSMLEQKPNLSVRDACYLVLKKFLHQPLKVTRELSENDQLNSETEKLIRNLLIPQNGDKGDPNEF